MEIHELAARLGVLEREVAKASAKPAKHSAGQDGQRMTRITNEAVAMVEFKNALADALCSLQRASELCKLAGHGSLVQSAIQDAQRGAQYASNKACGY